MTEDESNGKPKRPSYPGPRQILRYLRIVQENLDDGTVTARTPALDDLLDPGGAMRLGAIAPMCDLISGSVSSREVSPDWVATLEFKLHLSALVRDGWAHARCRPIRVSKNNIVSRSRVFDDAGRVAGTSYVTFSRLPRREDNPRVNPFKRSVMDYASPDEEPRLPLDEYLGLRFLGRDTLADPTAAPSGDAPPVDVAVLELDHHPRIHNSFGSIQGGATAALLERAGAYAAELALGVPTRSIDLHFHYLAQARVSPFRVTAEVVRADERGVLCAVELTDLGQDGRLAAVGTVFAVPIAN